MRKAELTFDDFKLLLATATAAAATSSLRNSLSSTKPSGSAQPFQALLARTLKCTTSEPLRFRFGTVSVRLTRCAAAVADEDDVQTSSQGAQPLEVIVRAVVVVDGDKISQIEVPWRRDEDDVRMELSVRDAMRSGVTIEVLLGSEVLGTFGVLSVYELLCERSCVKVVTSATLKLVLTWSEDARSMQRIARPTVAAHLRLPRHTAAVRQASVSVVIGGKLATLRVSNGESPSHAASRFIAANPLARPRHELLVDVLQQYERFFQDLPMSLGVGLDRKQASDTGDQP